MKKEEIEKLIHEFNHGAITSAGERELEKLIENGEVDLEQLRILDLQQRVESISHPSPGRDLDDRFYNMLALQKRSLKRFDLVSFFSWPSFAPKLALASVTLLVGLLIGYFLMPKQQDGSQMQALTQEVSQLKEMMMLSLLEKESATDRLKAVSLTSEMNSVSTKVTDALIQTLNQDENVNVRLAALEALKPYTTESSVREKLIRSIAKQTSPLVQLALADLMSQLQIKSSVKELEKIVESDQTPTEVKERIKQNIKVLI